MNNKRIKVGYVVAQVGSKPNSGPNIYLRNLITNIHKNHSEDIEVLLFRSEAKDDTLDLGVKDFTISDNKLRSYMQLSSLIRKSECDLVHLNLLPVENVLFYNYSCKKAVTMHGDLAFTEPQLAATKMIIRQKYGFRLVNRLGRLKNVDLFFPVSNSVFTQLSKHINIDPDKVYVTYNGIDHKMFNAKEGEKDNDILNTYNLSKGSYILHINNYAEKKNALTLVQSFVKYKSINPDAFLLIIGRRWENEKVSSILSQSSLKADKDYKIIPGLANPELPPFYRNAKVFLNPTIHETFGITNLEAMACGCPVISTNRYSIPEVVGESAILVDDPFDLDSFVAALDKVHKDAEKESQMIQTGIQRAKLFSWEATAAKTAQAYLSLFQK